MQEEGSGGDPNAPVAPVAPVVQEGISILRDNAGPEQLEEDQQSTSSVAESLASGVKNRGRVKSEVSETHSFVPIVMESTSSHSNAWMTQMDKLENPEDWEMWTGNLEANLIFLGLWDQLMGNEKMAESTNRKLTAILMMITKGTAWTIVSTSKKRGKDAVQIYKDLTAEYDHVDFARVASLWDKLHVTSTDYASVDAYGKAILDAYNKLQDLGLDLPSWVLTMTILHGLDESWSMWKTQYFTSKDLTADLFKNGKADEDQLNARTLLNMLREQERREQKDDATKAMKSANLRTQSNRSRKKQGGGGGNSEKQNTTSSSSNGAKRCKECHDRFHTVENCWFKHPDKANEEWRERYPTAADRKTACEKRKENNKNRIENKGKKEEKEKPEGEKPSRGKAMLAKASTPASSNQVIKKALSINSGGREWYLDTGGGRHMTGRRDWLLNFKKIPASHPMETVTGEVVKAEGIGNVQLETIICGQPDTVQLKEVYYYPGLDANLISFGKLERNGMRYIVDNGVISGLKDSECMFEACRAGDVYILNQPLVNVDDEEFRKHRAYAASQKGETLTRWHRRMGHVNEDYLRQLPRLVEGMNILPGELPFCEDCAMSKSHLQHHKGPAQNRAKEPLGRVHADLCGGGKTLSTAGNRCYLLLTDDATRMRWALLLKKKSDAVHKFRDWLKAVELETEKKLKIFRADGGGEFVAFDSLLVSKGIAFEDSAPHAPEQNGVSERGIKTVTEKARAMLLDANLPLSLWGYVVDTAVYIANRQPNRSLNKKTPLEGWTGKKPDVSHLREWGCAAYVHDYSQGKKKLEARAWEGRLIGYEGTNQYLIWDGKRAYLRRDVVFNEDKKGRLTKKDKSASESTPESVTLQLCEPYQPQEPEARPQAEDIDDILDLVNGFRRVNAGAEGERTSTNPPTIASTPAPEGAQQAPEGENPSREDSQTNSQHQDSIGTRDDVEPTNEDPIQDDQEEDDDDISEVIVVNREQPTADELRPLPDNTVTVRRSDRNTNRPNYKELIQDGLKGREPGFRRVAKVTKELIAKTPNETEIKCPRTFEEAMASPQHREWFNAMLDELMAHHEKGTWILVPRRWNMKVLGGTWTFKLKLAADGSIARYKARWCAQGFSQRPGKDYDETYAPVVRSSTAKIIQSIAICLSWFMKQWDVKTAFLNGKLDRWLHMIQPIGFEEGDDLVCCLLLPLYGLKQSGREWYLEIGGYLITIGFKMSMLDEALYINEGRSTYLTLYVDDIRIYGPDEQYLDEVLQGFNDKYTMADVTDTNQYLGMEMTSDSGGGILLTQQRKIEDGLKAFGLENCKAVKTPMDGYLEPAPEGFKANPEDQNVYQQLLGRAMHLMCQTRPDITYPVNALAQHGSNPTDAHWQALKRVWRYLGGTKTMGTYYRKGPPTLYAWTDSNWDPHLNDGRSTSGYVFLLGDGPVSWASSKQATVATSSTVAEYYAQYAASCELAWIRELLAELKIQEINLRQPTTVYADNQGAIKLAKTTAYRKRSKHIAVRYHWTRQMVTQKEMHLEYLKTEDMLADGLTKPLKAVKFKEFVDMLGLRKKEELNY